MKYILYSFILFLIILLPLELFLGNVIENEIIGIIIYFYSLLVETYVAYLFIKNKIKRGDRFFLLYFIMTCITFSAFFIINKEFNNYSKLELPIIIYEILIVLIEAVGVYFISRNKAIRNESYKVSLLLSLKVSFISNSTSFLLSAFIFYINYKLLGMLLLLIIR
ncbi:MAG: hypothetical protein HXX16_11885 [Bacteroidales bacterium]|nr:hypothetical protein [Bacteroidales bacterium]